MGKTVFNIGKNIFAAYGAISFVGAVIVCVANHTADKKTPDETVTKKNGKTYFSVQNKEHDENEPMGFHIG